MTDMYCVSRKPLSDYVDCLWQADGYMQPHAQEFVLPTGSMTLVVDLNAQTADAVLIGGARSCPFMLDTSKPLRLVAAHFKPGGGFPFADCPAGELHNLHVPLTTFWPTEASDLCERLVEAATNRERFHVLECFLLQRLRATRPSSAVVGYAIRRFQQASPTCSVSTVRDQIGISARRFIEMFRRDVGMSPKVFAR